MYEEALAKFQKEKEIARGWGLRVEAQIGIVYAKMGNREKAQDVLEELIKKSKETYVSSTAIAMLYIALEEDDKGFQWLELAYENYDSWLRLLKIDPIFDRIRSDPRFISLVKKIGIEK